MKAPAMKRAMKPVLPMRGWVAIAPDAVAGNSKLDAVLVYRRRSQATGILIDHPGKKWRFARVEIREVAQKSKPSKKPKAPTSHKSPHARAKGK